LKRKFKAVAGPWSACYLKL